MTDGRISRSANNNSIYPEKVEPIVFTDNGGLEGYIMKTIRQRNIFAFEGVPFGESTAGPNRFQPPVPKKPWTGIRSAKKPGAYCLQFNIIRPRIMGDENCLFLNVYTPILPQSRQHRPLPVIVFIHGGSWYFGAGSEYGPAYLLEEDVILVTLNYRMGVLGFVSTGNEDLPGNMGMKDQVLAMKWVYENIKNFGGDPKRITLAGHSSGATSVQLHMISQTARQYFTQGLSISSSAFVPWAVMTEERMKLVNTRLAKAMGCPYDEKNTKPYADCLKTRNPHMLTGKILNTFDWAFLPLVPIGTVVEKPGPGAYLTETPEEAYKRGSVAKKPWVTLRTPDEGHLISTILDAFGVQVALKMMWNNMAPTFLEFGQLSNKANLTKLITKFYTGSEDARAAKTTTPFGDIFTDRELGYGIHKAIQAHSEIAPTYAATYSYKAKKGLASIMGVNQDAYGVTHVDSLFTVFNMSIYQPGYMTTDPEFEIVKLMSNLYSNYAAKGVPSYTDGETGEDVKVWDPITDPSKINVIQIDKEVKMIPEPDTHRFKFWESLALADMKPWIPL